MSLGLVVFVMRQVSEPENVARVAQVFSGGETPEGDEGKVPAASPPPIGSDSFQAVSSVAPDSAIRPIKSEAIASPEAQKLDELLSLAGWTPDRFAEFADGEALTDGERDELIQLLWRVQTFDNSYLVDTAREPIMLRGKVYPVSGKAKNFERHALSAEDATRFEMPAYYTCDVGSEDGRVLAKVVTAAVPRRWEQIAKLDEPVRLSGLYIKKLPDVNDEPGIKNQVELFVAKRIAWHPDTPREPVVSLGMSILGSLGMDVGLLDQVRSHGRLRTSDAAEAVRFNDQREAFYQMLDAAGRIGANQLIRFADGNLETIRGKWERELKEARDANRRALASEVIERARPAATASRHCSMMPRAKLGSSLWWTARPGESCVSIWVRRKPTAHPATSCAASASIIITNCKSSRMTRRTIHSCSASASCRPAYRLATTSMWRCELPGFFSRTGCTRLAARAILKRVNLILATGSNSTRRYSSAAHDSFAGRRRGQGGGPARGRRTVPAGPGGDLGRRLVAFSRRPAARRAAARGRAFPAARTIVQRSRRAGGQGADKSW